MKFNEETLTTVEWNLKSEFVEKFKDELSARLEKFVKSSFDINEINRLEKTALLTIHWNISYSEVFSFLADHIFEIDFEDFEDEYNRCRQTIVTSYSELTRRYQEHIPEKVKIVFPAPQMRDYDSMAEKLMKKINEEILSKN